MTFRSQHYCDVTVYGEGRLETSTCHETHLFQPFSSSTSGALAKVEQKMKFVSELTIDDGDWQLDQGVETSLLYIHQGEEGQDKSDDVSQHVLNLLNSYKNCLENERANLFTDLVHSMRELSHAQLLSIFYNGIHDDETRQLAMDAIPLLKTDAGITLMKDIMESGQLSSDTLDMWLATLPYYKSPTRSMISVVFVSCSN